MIKKTLIAATLALLAAGTAQPAQADATFLEPYGNTFTARPLLALPGDTRPTDAFTGQASRVEDPTQRLFVSPFFRIASFPGLGGRDIDVSQYGAGIGYANTTARFPFLVTASFFNTNIDVDGLGDDNAFSFDVTGKIVLWNPSPNLPVASIVGRFQNYDDIGQRYDVLLALDQRVTRDVFLTANLGYASFDPEFFQSQEDFVARFGATWRASQRLSFSFDYTLDNDVDGEDFWTLSGTWAANESIAVRFGGGKHETFFGNLIWKTDWR